MSRPELASGCLVLPVRALRGVGGCGTGSVVVRDGLAHCWVLKHQALTWFSWHWGLSALWRGLVVGGVWGGWWFWIPPFALSPACVGGGGLVGLLFEICIVDASINKNLS
jgi:hypothetical protein